jgi:hypothetical protein
MYKKKLLLCSPGYAGRKIPSGENQNRYLMLFADRHGFTALQAVQSGSFSYTCNTEYSLRRAESTEFQILRIITNFIPQIKSK